MSYTINTHSEEELKIKASQFIAEIFPVNNIEEVNHFLNQVKEMHPKANHHCWAYKLGVPMETYRANDDGEPSGTAGKPILGQLDAFDVTNILCVVTRYFGGTLLGTGGLIKAYKESTKEVLSKAELMEVKPIYKVRVEFAFEQIPMIMEASKRFPGIIEEKDLATNPFLILSTESENLDHLINVFKSQVLGIEVDHASGLEEYGFTIEKI